MKETQATIAAWRDATFGPKGSTFRMACRANEEMAELLRAVSADAPRKEVAKEIADVLICLYGVADAIGAEVPDALPYRSESDSSKVQSVTGANYGMSVLVGTAGDHGRSEEGKRLSMSEALIQTCSALYDLAAKYGIDAAAAVDEKMAINRTRVWKLDGTGCAYHVREEKRKKTPPAAPAAATPAPPTVPLPVREQILSAMRDGVCRSVDIYKRINAHAREVRDALSSMIDDGTVTAGTDWVLSLREAP